MARFRQQLRLDFSPENDSQEVIAKLLANVRDLNQIALTLTDNLLDTIETLWVAESPTIQ